MLLCCSLWGPGSRFNGAKFLPKTCCPKFQIENPRMNFCQHVNFAWERRLEKCVKQAWEQNEKECSEWGRIWALSSPASLLFHPRSREANQFRLGFAFCSTRVRFFESSQNWVWLESTWVKLSQIWLMIIFYKGSKMSHIEVKSINIDTEATQWHTGAQINIGKIKFNPS